MRPSTAPASAPTSAPTSAASPGPASTAGFDYPPKILLTKIGLDGHDRGARLVAAFLRDAGMEVIYTGPWQQIPDVVKMAMEEDVDVIAISTLASDHLLVPKLMEALAAAGLAQVGVVLGGAIPLEDDGWLREAGVEMIARPGASSAEIVRGITEIVTRVRAESGTQ